MDRPTGHAATPNTTTHHLRRRGARELDVTLAFLRAPHGQHRAGASHGLCECGLELAHLVRVGVKVTVRIGVRVEVGVGVGVGLGFGFGFGFGFAFGLGFGLRVGLELAHQVSAARVSGLLSSLGAVCWP